MRTLVLWDVDHTLVAIKGLSQEIYGRVLAAVTGRTATSSVVMAGRTERAIITDTLLAHGLAPDEDVICEIADAISKAYVERGAEIPDRGHALPGALDALAALAARRDVVQSLLTGNTEPIARVKLAAFGLADFVDFSVGAYGMDHFDRPPLVELARQRAARVYGETFGPTSTVLIGDTPHDVRAGHAGGARVVAVATGGSSREELRAAGAEQILEGLTDTAAVVRAVLAVGSP